MIDSKLFALSKSGVLIERIFREESTAIFETAKLEAIGTVYPKYEKD